MGRHSNRLLKSNSLNAPGGIVRVHHQQVRVADLPPRTVLQMPEQVLQDHRRLEHEPRARFQRRRDGAHERHVPFVVQITEAVADAERAVEPRGPWQVAHVTPFPRHAVPGIAGACVVQEFSGPVHARHAVAAVRERERQPAGAARDVQDLASRRDREHPREGVRLSLRLLRRHRLEPQVDRHALEKLLPPIRLHIHDRSPGTQSERISRGGRSHAETPSAQGNQ